MTLVVQATDAKATCLNVLFESQFDNAWIPSPVAQPTIGKRFRASHLRDTGAQAGALQQVVGVNV